MIEAKGNIFDVKADLICVTTNGVVINGSLVMGKGLALEFKKRWPWLPKTLAMMIATRGNYPVIVTHNPQLEELKPFIASFPTKNHWRDNSELALIERSARVLVKLVDGFEEHQNRLDTARATYGIKKPVPLKKRTITRIALTRPGCGLGNLDWERQVKPRIEDILDDRFIVLG